MMESCLSIISVVLERPAASSSGGWKNVPILSVQPLLILAIIHCIATFHRLLSSPPATRQSDRRSNLLICPQPYIWQNNTLLLYTAPIAWDGYRCMWRPCKLHLWTCCFTWHMNFPSPLCDMLTVSQRLKNADNLLRK